jgi:hypothetical protein
MSAANAGYNGAKDLDADSLEKAIYIWGWLTSI